MNLTVRQVEGRSGVNRGTISQVLRGLRHCAPEDRHALMIALDFNAAEHRTFLPSRELSVPDLVLYDSAYPYGGSYLPIQRGRELLMRSLFSEGRRQLNDAFSAALARQDYVRAADAAEVMAWLELEAMEPRKFSPTLPCRSLGAVRGYPLSAETPIAVGSLASGQAWEHRVPPGAVSLHLQSSEPGLLDLRQRFS